MQRKNNCIIADLHTHILPCLDDGASSVEESVQLLLTQKRQGITDVVFTPHFILQNESVEDFLERRNTSFAELREKIKENDELKDLRLHLGAEVRYDPNLVYADLFKLCIENTSYLLLELEGNHSFNLEQTLNFMLAKGVSPILAHIERYDYLISDKKLLEELIYAGVVFQCNASSIFSKHYSRKVNKLLKQGYVHILASDTHNMSLRAPRLVEALNKLPKYSQRLISNSQDIIEDKLL